MGRDRKGLVSRGIRKPPGAIVRRVQHEIAAEAERVLAPVRARQFTTRTLLHATQSDNLDALWQYLGARPYPALTDTSDLAPYDDLCPGDRQPIRLAAERGMAPQVDSLGTGLINLGSKIDWHKD